MQVCLHIYILFIQKQIDIVYRYFHAVIELIPQDINWQNSEARAWIHRVIYRIYRQGLNQNQHGKILHFCNGSSICVSYNNMQREN